MLNKLIARLVQLVRTPQLIKRKFSKIDRGNAGSNFFSFLYEKNNYDNRF
jgi:hypothetical protein